MSPEYGATIGFFPVDEKTCDYLTATGRSVEHVETIRNYFKAQGMFGMPKGGGCRYSQVLELDLASITPSVAGPKRPQDRIDLPELKKQFIDLLTRPATSGGYNKRTDEISRRLPTAIGLKDEAHAPMIAGGGDQATDAPIATRNNVTAHNTSAWTEREMINNRPTPDHVRELADGQPNGDVLTLGHGDVLIAAITSCTNTSNPSVMLAAGLLAKKAVERGLEVRRSVKTSLAPGSRVVSDYLDKSGLQPYLDRLGFNLVGYGCTTCIGNSGPLDPEIEKVVLQSDLVGASVLSGNRNFEARVHQNVKANFLMSPPLVVAFALAGTVEIDLANDPIGKDKSGSDVYLRDLWPSLDEINDLMKSAFDPATYRRLYGSFAEQNPMWNEIPSATGTVYDWDPESTYIQEPPFFSGFSLQAGQLSEITGARPLAIFGDSVTTDHISPAGAIKPSSPAGLSAEQGSSGRRLQ
jgi:aconitate hydratase